MEKRTLRKLVTVSLLVGSSAAFAACNSGDDDVVTQPPKKDASADSTTTVEAGSDSMTAPPVQAICEKYGADKVPAITTSLLAKLKADCRIGVYFTELPDQGAHFQSCLNVQLSYFFGCPNSSYGDDAKDTSGKACRSMQEAHKTMKIRAADFKAFDDDLIAALTANGITDVMDVQSIVAKIGTTQPGIVTDPGRYDSRCTCENGLYDGGACNAEAAAALEDAGDGGDAAHEGGTDGGGGNDSGSQPDTGGGGNDAGSDAPNGD